VVAPGPGIYPADRIGIIGIAMVVVISNISTGIMRVIMIIWVISIIRNSVVVSTV
jgi:hypothetical protein